jgi:hypothetical protein
MSVARLYARWLIFAALLTGGLAAPCHAGGAFRYCDPSAELDASQQDTLFRFAAVIRSTLQSSGATLALVSRAGYDLSRFGMRYSHAGISLRDNPSVPWSVRQLYFDCTERRPRIFDEGIAGFLVGAGDPSVGYFSVVFIPEAEAELARLALDNRTALKLLGGTYSANAYAFGERYQNCNQWVAEMLGLAWGGLGNLPPDMNLRAESQRWLRSAGYEPAKFTSANPIMIWAGATLPWLHSDDHPAQNLADGHYTVSMPHAIEAFARARVPGARRVEFCHANRRIVVREGWEPIAAGCVPGAGDQVIALD